MQLPLFEIPGARLEYETEPGHRRSHAVHTMTVYDEEGLAIIFIEAEAKNWRTARADLTKLAREALLLNKSRPFGDEYLADGCRVSYLFDK
jgi:hypothetical protein